MANQGWFDKTATSAGWFDPTAAARGWFDRTFTDLDPVASGDPGTQPVQGTRGVRQKAASWRTAVLAASLLITGTVEAAANNPPVQPETWPQAVQGTQASGYAARSLRGRATLAQRTYYQGTAESAIVVQPETWTQPVQGTGALARQQRAWSRTAAGLGRLWQTPEDVTTEPETWTQPVSGTSALRQQATGQRLQRVRSAPLWQTLPEEDGPLATQPETWPQAVQGLTAVRARAHAVRTRAAAQTLLYGTTAQDPPPLVPPDQWTQAVSGTAALRTASQQVRMRVVLFAPLLWQTPEDVSGPLATQPDTWQPPIAGTTAQALAQRLFRSRGVRAQALGQTVNDVSAIAEPETWISPIVGLSSLRQQQRAWRETATRLSPRLYWQTVDLSTGPLAVQPDTWVQPIGGSRALRTLQQQLRAIGLRVGAYLWQRPPEDLSLLGSPPQTSVVSTYAPSSAITGTSTPLTAITGTYAPTATSVIGTVTLANDYRAAVLADGPIGYWRLGEASGLVAADSSGNGRDGTYTGGVTLAQAGALSDGNTAALFNGSTGQVTTTAAALQKAAGPFTLEAWVKSAAGGSDAGIVGRGVPNNMQLTWHTGTAIYFYAGNSWATAPLSGNAWHHVVGTWDGTTAANAIKLYIDGVLVAQGTSTTTVITPSALCIGQAVPGTFFSGSIDEVAVYPLALTPTQITKHYQIDLTESNITLITCTYNPHTDCIGTAD